MTRRRTSGRAAALALIVAGVIALAGPASATFARPTLDRPIEVAANTLPAISGSVDDFTFASFSADYALDRDSDGRSSLTTVETLVAVFPDVDQNHGIRRAIPLSYDGHPTDAQVVSVLDGAGQPRAFTTAVSDDGQFLLVTVAASGFVHGEQTYTLTYTQKNVTRYFADTGRDEFYWDTNGTGWAQPFGTVTARVSMPADLAAALTGDAACYAGAEGSRSRCTLAGTVNADGGMKFTASESNVAAFENLTVAIGFQAGTFVPRDDSAWSSAAAIGQLATIVLAVLAAVAALLYRRVLIRDARGRPTIIAEYTPPDNASVFESAVIVRRTKRAAAAGLVGLAVSGNAQIIEGPSESRFSSRSGYRLRFIKADGLDRQGLAFAHVFFGDDLAHGHERSLRSRDQALARKVVSFMQQTKNRTYVDGFRRKNGLWPAQLLFGLAVAFVVWSFFLGSQALNEGTGGFWYLFPVPVLLLGGILIDGAVFRAPLTVAGAELRDYIKGLELYIRLAEKDRMRVLQSPEGALKTPMNTADPSVVVELYEKLLPYAVLLGLEHQWGEVLGTYYERLGSQPEWYSGIGPFQAGLFAASIGSFAAATAASYTGTATSSSSGGSSGGGFSGGGGGGGGGGGV
jgi:uncharacterized membrane protein YgcG